MRVWTVDFETEKILPRPHYPPKPVGVAVRRPGAKTSKYYAWGHPCENNCSKDDAAKILQEIWDSNLPVNFQNGKFDQEVAQKFFGLPILPWERYHDTMFLIALFDPHADSFSLKPSAERILGRKPVERDALKDWILANVPEAKRSPSKWGAHISLAPGKLVGSYAADGDADMTHDLLQHLLPIITDAGMLGAYERERKLMPILLRNEQEGVRVDLKRMEADLVTYQAAAERVDTWLRDFFKKPSLNLDSNDELADCLDEAGLFTDWTLTPKGKRSTAKKNMPFDKIADIKVASALGYRNRLATCVGTFMLPWLEVARETKGLIHTSWNQVRQNRSGSDPVGTRTGRMSSTPNFQNIPKSFVGNDDGYTHPVHLADLIELPLMRQYILPDKGQVIYHRDYNQQELRILAHFEDGTLMKRYLDNPRLDVHTLVHDIILDLTGVDYKRSYVKQVNFGKIYGMGQGALAQKIKDSTDVAKRLLDAHKKALPGVAELEKTIKAIGRAGECITTWGGRRYYCEEPVPSKFGSGMQTFEYKLLNYLVQGSAADCTKEATIRYDEVRKDGRFILQVHDEMNGSCPKKALHSEMKILRDVMSSVEFDVPMISDGKWGPNWGSLQKYEEK